MIDCDTHFLVLTHMLGDCYRQFEDADIPESQIRGRLLAALKHNGKFVSAGSGPTGPYQEYAITFLSGNSYRVRVVFPLKRDGTPQPSPDGKKAIAFAVDLTPVVRK